MITKFKTYFDNKRVCEKCKKKLHKSAFKYATKESICYECDIKEQQDKKNKESQINYQYIENNCRELFVTHCETYVSKTVISFDVLKKEPCKIEAEAYGPRDSLLYWSYSHIDFDDLKDLAKTVSEETYEKHKNMNESNWKVYIEF